jgi:hypothetical protein
MSQQINLLRPKDRTATAAGMAAAALGIGLLMLLGVLHSVRSETAQLRETAKLGEQRATQVKIAIQQLQTSKDSGEEAAIAAEIASLRPRAEAVVQLVRSVRSGNLGNAEGFARYYGTLAGVAVEGLWITNVSVTNAGKSVTISGRALRNESVMQYAQRLNEAFTPHGVRFNALELTPEVVKPAAPGAEPPLSTIAFKLS